jgi:anti-anti-sigma factor
MEERAEPGGAVRLVVHGELDLAVVGALGERLAKLRERARERGETVVKLDLSQLSFMDSTGLGVVLTAVLDARRDGWRLEVERELPGPVARVVEISGAEPYLWPE